ncbi:MAG: oligosaccharide flippase family protein [Gordonia sp. (in: high G+C Gram-positive bacteria)]
MSETSQRPDPEVPENGTGTGTPGLAGTLKKAATAAVVGLVVVQGVGIIQTLVLGRLLGPTEVGLFAAGTVLLGFISVVSQGALSQALIQRKTEIEVAANTVLVVTFGIGVLLACGLAALSPVLGIVFHSSEVTYIALASAGMVLLHACTSVPDALMQRELKVYRKLIIDPAATIVYAVVAIALALTGMGAWAMVIGTYASQIVWVGLSWSLAGWKPSLKLFSVRVWRELSAFSFPLLVNSVAERIRETVEQILVGQFLGARALGQFRYGHRLGSMPSVAILQICSYLLFPAFAQIAHDRERFVHAYHRAAGWLWAAALPVAFLMVLAAEPVVVALLGSEWQPAGAAAAGMAGVGPGMAMAAVAAESIKGIGRPRALTWLSISSLVAGLPLVWWMTTYGLTAVGIAISIMYLATGFGTIVVAGRILDIPLRSVVGRVLGVTTAATAAFVIVEVVDLVFIPAPNLLVELLECLVYLVLYVAVLAVVDRARVRVMVGELRKLSRRRPGRGR